MTDIHIEVELCEPSPFIFGENGHLAVTDGETVWIVVVTEEAMKATADPPAASLKRLARYANFYRDIAAAALARGEDGDGKIWIRERDVFAWTQCAPARTDFCTISVRPVSANLDAKTCMRGACSSCTNSARQTATWGTTNDGVNDPVSALWGHPRGRTAGSFTPSLV